MPRDLRLPNDSSNPFFPQPPASSSPLLQPPLMVELAEIDASLTRIGMAAAVTSSWPSSPVPAATDPDASVSSTREQHDSKPPGEGVDRRPAGGRLTFHVITEAIDRISRITVSDKCDPGSGLSVSSTSLLCVEHLVVEAFS